MKGGSCKPKSLCGCRGRAGDSSMFYPLSMPSCSWCDHRAPRLEPRNALVYRLICKITVDFSLKLAPLFLILHALW